MNCLKSFVVKSNLNTSFPVGISYANWTIGTERYWTAQTNSAVANFNVAGFKNINIFGFDVMGDFHTASPNNGIVDDWRINLEFVGQAPIIGGNINPVSNAYNLNTDAAFINDYQLSRYKTKIELATPIQSVTQIRFGGYQANGYGNQSLTDINLNWDLIFVFYYQFEGE